MDINDETPWYETIPIPALLRHARNTYGVKMRQALEAAGYDDVPGNGLYVIGGLALGAGEIPLGQLVRELRISKQAAGTLVDSLVNRGYLERTVDKDDRRKLTIALTDRGVAAAGIQTTAREKIDKELIAAVGAEHLAATRKTLAALCGIGHDDSLEGTGASS
jgi:DNA-binding MarR family transcriptional regulator